MFKGLLLIYGFAFVNCDECETLEFDLTRCLEFYGDGFTDTVTSIVTLGNAFAEYCFVIDALAECRNNANSKCPTHADKVPYLSDELSLRVMVYGACRYRTKYEDGVECFGYRFKELENRARQIFSNAFMSLREREDFNTTDFCRKYSAKTRILRNYIRTFNCPDSFTTYVTQATITYMPLYCEAFKDEHTWLKEFLTSESVINTPSFYMNLVLLMLRILLG